MQQKYAYLVAGIVLGAVVYPRVRAAMAARGI